jgi:phosphotriesterase-related protein
MNRREFLIGGVATPLAAAAATQPSILTHEHVLVDFIGAAKIGPGRYDPDAVFNAAKPKLDEVKQLGCQRMLECTPNFLGRDPQLLARLAAATGLEIWTNTGLYGASEHKYLPSFVNTETAEQLGKRWIAEAHQPWKPRFIKIGVNRGPLDLIDRKLVRAAAITSRETGLAIACHTGNGLAAREELDILRSERVSPSKLVWVHAHNEKDHSIHEELARAGAWVEFDGIAAKSAAWHLDCVRFMATKGLLRRTLISQDSGWYHVGEPGGGEFRGYAYIYTDFLPRLEPAWVSQLMWVNPREAFGYEP